MRVVVIGCGYVGLVSGACLAELGHTVACVDVDAGKVDALSQGLLPIYEPGLDEIVDRNVREGRLTFGTDLAGKVPGAAMVFIAVGTPSRRGDGHADLSYVYACARDIAAALDGPAIIVTKSTVPVGTGDRIEEIIGDLRPDADVRVVSNPEFLREGVAIGDFMQPDRIVVGSDDPTALRAMAELYRPLTERGAPLLSCARRSAELSKYACNAFLATKLSFINEMADLCERAGADVRDVAAVMGSDARIGGRFLAAGPGYGGSCLPKDVQALVRTAQDYGAPVRVAEMAGTVNELRKRAIARRIKAACGGTLAGRTVALLGLTFKADTDDMRDAPSLALIQALQDAGARVRAYDPQGMEEARQLTVDVTFAPDAYSCAGGSDAVVVVTEWREFRDLDLDRLRNGMTAAVLVDLRNLVDRDAALKAGFAYHGVGTPAWHFAKRERAAALVAAV